MLEGTSLMVAVAETSEQHARGLMGVEDLGELDGMLFIFLPPRSVSFWMKDTVIPLDAGYFDATGKLFQIVEMVPCETEECPSFGSSREVRWALEVPAGSLPELREGALLS